MRWDVNCVEDTYIVTNTLNHLRLCYACYWERTVIPLTRSLDRKAAGPFKCWKWSFCFFLSEHRPSLIFPEKDPEQQKTWKLYFSHLYTVSYLSVWNIWNVSPSHLLFTQLKSSTWKCVLLIVTSLGCFSAPLWTLWSYPLHCLVLSPISQDVKMYTVKMYSYCRGCLGFLSGLFH